MNQCVSGDTLAAVYRHAHTLAKLRNTLTEALEPEMRAHFMGVSGNSERLVIFADSATWATRLRYQAPDLEEAATRHLGSRPALVFRVLTDLSPSAPATLRSPWLPERVVATLEASARTVGDDELAAALRRLARGAAR
ncbi:MAG: DciA family protein [Gammaproteobacteria bacterium]